MWWILGVGAIAIALIAVNTASASPCAVCWKPYAVFSVQGTLGYKRVCRACARRHHALKRNHAR